MAHETVLLRDSSEITPGKRGYARRVWWGRTHDLRNFASRLVAPRSTATRFVLKYDSKLLYFACFHSAPEGTTHRKMGGFDFDDPGAKRVRVRDECFLYILYGADKEGKSGLQKIK